MIEDANLRIEIAHRMLEIFKGRHDTLAVGQPDGKFHPVKISRPIKDMTVRFANQHLGGKQCLGFYLLTDKAKVWCSCVDLDNKPNRPDPDWRDKATKIYLLLQNLQLYPVAEVSASGNACHIWLFFAEEVDGWLARSWWDVISKHTGIKFVEIYPRQSQANTIGNLIRYPLWNASHFADPDMDWVRLDPMEVMGRILGCHGLSDDQRVTAADLRDRAFQLGHDLTPMSSERVNTKSVLGETSTSMPLDLPARVKSRLSDSSSRLSKRWHGDTFGLVDNSRTGLVQSIIFEMLRSFVPTPEIDVAIRIWGKINNYTDKTERPDWRALSIGSCCEFLFNRQQEQITKSMTMEEAAQDFLSVLAEGKQTVYKTGIVQVDASIGGISPGAMVVVAGRPGHGKSVMAGQWLDNAALAGQSGLIISEEMSARQLGRRAVESFGSLDPDSWRPADVPDLARDIREHYSKRSPIYVSQNCGSIANVESTIDKFVADRNVAIVAVDYLQLLHSKGKNRYEEVSDVSRRLKQAAIRNNVCVVAVAQLNREVDGRQGFEPQLSDLRDSGGIEQDADVVLFVQWPYKYNSKSGDPRKYKIYVKKNRDGAINEPEIDTEFIAARHWIGVFSEHKEENNTCDQEVIKEVFGDQF